MLDAVVQDKRTTTRRTITDVLTGEVSVQESHEDWRYVIVTEDLPEEWKSDAGILFKPDLLQFRWRWARKTYVDDCEPYWYFAEAELSGLRIKKDGSLGSELCKRYLLSPEAAKALGEELDMPDFVLELYEAYNPGSGKPYSYPVHQRTADDEEK